MLQRPELRRQRTRRRLQQRRACRRDRRRSGRRSAQRRPAVLVEGAHILRDLGALQDAQRLGDLEGDAAGDARRASAAVSSSLSGPSRRVTWALSQAFSRASTFSRAGPVSCSSASSAKLRLEQLSPGGELCRPGRPVQRSAPSFDEHEAPHRPPRPRRAARASISPASAFCGGVAQRLAPPRPSRRGRARSGSRAGGLHAGPRR